MSEDERKQVMNPNAEAVLSAWERVLNKEAVDRVNKALPTKVQEAQLEGVTCMKSIHIQRMMFSVLGIPTVGINTQQ